MSSQRLQNVPSECRKRHENGLCFHCIMIAKVPTLVRIRENPSCSKCTFSRTQNQPVLAIPEWPKKAVLSLPSHHLCVVLEIYINVQFFVDREGRKCGSSQRHCMSNQKYHNELMVLTEIQLHEWTLFASLHPFNRSSRNICQLLNQYSLSTPCQNAFKSEWLVSLSIPQYARQTALKVSPPATKSQLQEVIQLVHHQN